MSITQSLGAQWNRWLVWRFLNPQPRPQHRQPLCLSLYPCQFRQLWNLRQHPLQLQ